jgi:hypothetical protein
VFGSDLPFDDSVRGPQEVAADAFASEFMLPRWLYKHHIRAQKWRVSPDLHDPGIVYQLSLRMGASYAATCWGLAGHEILPTQTVKSLRRLTVADLKGKFGEGVDRANSWADVWRLTRRDSGSVIVGNPDDLIRLDLEEAASSGYLWNPQTLAAGGFQILRDESAFAREPIHYGGPSIRTLIVQPPTSGASRIDLQEAQPWRAPTADDPTFVVKLALSGREAGGLSRVERHRGTVG